MVDKRPCSCPAPEAPVSSSDAWSPSVLLPVQSVSLEWEYSVCSTQFASSASYEEDRQFLPVQESPYKWGLLARCLFTAPSNENWQGSRGVTTVCLVYTSPGKAWVSVSVFVCCGSRGRLAAHYHMTLQVMLKI